MNELILKCWAKGRDGAGMPLFCDMEAGHGPGERNPFSNHHNVIASRTWEPSGCDKGHGPNDRPTAALRLAQLGHELTVEYLARGGGADGGGSNAILIAMAGRLGDDFTTLEQIQRDYENIEASRRIGTGSDRYQEILSLASKVLRPFVSSAKTVAGSVRVGITDEGVKASAAGLKALISRAATTERILKDAGRAMFKTIVGEPMDDQGVAPSPPTAPPCTWFFLTKAQQDAITAHTSEGPEGGPNGPFEQAIVDIGDALEAEPPTAFTAKMNGLMAKLCEASANDTQALREAFGLAKDGVTPVAPPLDLVHRMAVSRAKAALNHSDPTTRLLAASLLWWIYEHDSVARRGDSYREAWEEASAAAFAAGASDPTSTLAERIGVLVEKRDAACRHATALIDAIHDLEIAAQLGK